MKTKKFGIGNESSERRLLLLGRARRELNVETGILKYISCICTKSRTDGSVHFSIVSSYISLFCGLA